MSWGVLFIYSFVRASFLQQIFFESLQWVRNCSKHRDTEKKKLKSLNLSYFVFIHILRWWSPKSQKSPFFKYFFFKFLSWAKHLKWENNVKEKLALFPFPYLCPCSKDYINGPNKPSARNSIAFWKPLCKQSSSRREDSFVENCKWGQIQLLFPTLHIYISHMII